MKKYFEYVRYTEVNTGDSTLSFNEIGTEVDVKILKKGYAVLNADTKKAITELIGVQNPLIASTIIPKEEFIEAVEDSEAVVAINESVNLRIRAKYTLAEELSMAHEDNLSAKKIAFLQYREEQRQLGKEQKAELGIN